MAQGITKQFRETRYGDTYRFRYVKNGANWAIYCTHRPANTRFSESDAVTHIFSDNSLCITRSAQPKTFEQAVARSWQWLAGYSHYIREGSFPNSRTRVITPDYDEQGNRTG